ncbi:MAG: proprotein convertase P-domain-containing protein [Ignavibacteriae bacterium]|nr:proprotein convertase P-domain-containing protein [Ignavibacteriota bacterium]
MRKLTLLSALLLVGVLLTTTTSWAQSYKFKSTPHAAITSSQTVVDQIYVPTNTKVTNVRVGIYAKTHWYSSLRIVLTSPTGYQVVLKSETAYGTNYNGSLGSERSYALFQDGGATNITNSPVSQPNDRPIAPATMLASLNGKPSQGWWTLQVIDIRNSTVPAQNGFLEGWYLVFNSVLKEPEIVLWEQIKTGSQLVGQLNGVIQTVPNETPSSAANPMCGAGANPNVVPGLNGEAYPFIISNLGYPGLLIGQPVPGYSTGGRFKITVNIATNVPPPGNPSPALTGDIAVYFGRSASYTAPLASPPSPPNTAGISAQWPTGPATTTNTLLGGNPIQGGVRLTACNSEQATPWGLSGGDMGGYIDCAFDDLALSSIETAETCGFGDGVCGLYKPETPLTALNGNPVEGLYYVTVYDTYGDRPFNAYGHVRVISILVQYLAGGGEVANPNMHEGIAGPLLGVPIPGAITGSPLGYLPDVISTIPPYSIHAKDQDPMLLFWGVQKMGPRSTIGWENVEARNGTNRTALVGDGPYAYPGSLDANPAKAGLTVNADLAMLPIGSYYLRSILSQQRADDDNTDNVFETMAPVQVTNTTLSYIGDRVNQWNGYNAGSQSGLFASFPLQANTANGSGFGITFTVTKNPVTTVTSLDYKLDRGLGQALSITWRTPLRISVWRCSNGYTGGPVGPPVAKSPTINADEWMPGNWRTFPLYACDAQGNITTNPTVNLAPGTYAVMLDNMGTANALIYPYTWGMLPFLNDRYWDFKFNENFGPLGPFSTLGTRFMYTYTSSGTAAPSAGVSALSATDTWGNWTLPMRLNMTTLNDFAIDYLSINGTKGTESVSITNAPFALNTIVTANSTQGGATKDFNARVQIYDQGNNRVYISDINYGPQGNPAYPGVNGYQSVSVPMAQWTPANGGLYKVVADFSRKPSDQNAVNDTHEFMLYVSNTRAILATGSTASTSDINSAVSALREKGVNVEVMNASDSRIATAKNTDIYLVGNVSDKAVISQSIENGNNVAFVYNRKDNFGKLLQVVDNVYSIERPGANYDKMTLFPDMKEFQATKSSAPASVPTFTSKEELASYIKANRPGIEPVESSPAREIDAATLETMVPVETVTPYGEIQSVDVEVGSTGILYTVPQNRKAGRSTVDQTVPAGFALDQNYPNPFNPSTSISYSLPQSSFVTLRVLDMLGREVMTLVSDAQEAGRYNISWKGMNNVGELVASGQYICRIDATPLQGGAAFSSQIKMTLSK